jgi:hypothetical protein
MVSPLMAFIAAYLLRLSIVNRSHFPPLTWNVHLVVPSQQLKKETWNTVQITGKFNRPVVVMGVMSYNGPHPVTIRVKDVTRTSFKWQMQEWSYLDKIHTKESISYMIVEEGTHKLLDRTMIQAGKTKAAGRWTSVKFDADFRQSPAVFAQITTQQKLKAYSTRLNYVTNKQFQVKM